MMLLENRQSLTEPSKASTSSGMGIFFAQSCRPFSSPSVRHDSQPKLSVPPHQIHLGRNFSHSWQKHAGMFGMGFKSRTEFPRQESLFLAGLDVETEPQDDQGQETADFADDQGRAQQAQQHARVN